MFDLILWTTHNLDIEDAQRRQDPYVFDFNDIPGVDIRTKISWDMLPVVTSLYNNPFFRSVSISKIDRKVILTVLTITF